MQAAAIVAFVSTVSLSHRALPEPIDAVGELRFGVARDGFVVRRVGHGDDAFGAGVGVDGTRFGKARDPLVSRRRASEGDEQHRTEHR